MIPVFKSWYLSPRERSSNLIPLSLSGLIIGVVVINIAIGLAQEGKAERAADAIKAMLSATATVVRDGKRLTLDADLLVPGDVVVVKSGDRLPADLRLLQVSKDHTFNT